MGATFSKDLFLFVFCFFCFFNPPLRRLYGVSPLQLNHATLVCHLNYSQKLFQVLHAFKNECQPDNKSNKKKQKKTGSAALTIIQALLFLKQEEELN